MTLFSRPKSRPWYVRFFFKLFRDAPYGSLTLTSPRGRVYTFQGTQAGVNVDLRVHDWEFVKRSLIRGDIGFGESYIDGMWDSSDIGRLMTYMVQNMDAIDELCHGSWMMRSLFRVINWVRDNSKTNSRKNIRAHYDVGNDFYRLWLDETMTYSSALFDADRTIALPDAQRAKYQRLIGKMSKENADILEIGCGWGGFADEANKAGHRLKGLTLSTEQLAYANERLAEPIAKGNVNLVLQDYRDEKGMYDYIASIEMFEAVGEKYWPTYFGVIKERLKTDGKALIQTITIDDDCFDSYRTRSDFIRHYTFPGGMLPSVNRVKEELENAGLVCREIKSFGLDYAETLRQWLAAMDAKRDAILALGYTDEFLRSWRFYMGCCIGAFDAQRTDVVQLEITHA